MKTLIDDFRQDWHKLPNLITLARLLLSPIPTILVLLAVLCLDPSLRRVASMLFVAIVTTDFLDGWLARKLDMVTDLGKLLDPTVDKVAVVAAFVGLFVINPWTVIPCLVISAREVSVTRLRAVAQQQGVTVAASWNGKVKAVAQYTAVALLLWPTTGLWLLFAWGAMAVAVILTVTTWVEYHRLIQQRLSELSVVETAAA